MPANIQLVWCTTTRPVSADDWSYRYGIMGTSIRGGSDDRSSFGRIPTQREGETGRKIRAVLAGLAFVCGVFYSACLLGSWLLSRSDALQFHFLVSYVTRGRVVRLGGQDAASHFRATNDRTSRIARSLGKHNERIVGGVPVDQGEYPFFAFPTGFMLCGASLIHSEYVHRRCGSVKRRRVQSVSPQFSRS
jgi:hypothetical protein